MAKKKNGADPGPGHNSALTDEEKRALTFHHAKLYAAADALVENRTAVMDLATSDLGKDVLLTDTPKKMKAVVERTLRLARWAGLPVGTQQALFEPVSNHFEEGKRAGMQGDNCEPPKSLAVDASQKWISGWHEGQTVLMAAFKKKRPVDGSPAAVDGQIDLEEAIAKFGERVNVTDDEAAKGYTAAFVNKDGGRVAMQVRI